MARPELEPGLFILAGINVLIPDQAANGSAGGHPVKNAGQDLDPVLFHPRGGRGTRPRFSFIDFPLDIILAERQTGGAAVNDHTHAPAVAFAKAGDSKKLAQTITHLSLPYPRCSLV